MDQLKLFTRSERRRIGSICSLLWVQTSLVVHVNNMKYYSSEVKDVKHKEVTRPRTKKKNHEAKDVGETLTEETRRANEPRNIPN